MGSNQAKTPAVLGGQPEFATPLYYTRARVPDRRAFDSYVDRVFASAWFTNDGELVRELERRLAERLGVGFCCLFANGTAALLAALKCLDLEGQVLTTPFTFAATVHAIAWNGLEPVFCDIDRDTWNLSADAAEAAVTEKTSAIVPVHVFGVPAALAELSRIAERHSLALLYDAAHAFDVRVGEAPIGSFGDLSVFSFHATKLFHTMEGGAVVGSDPALRDELALLRNFGIVNEEEVRGLGLNGKMSEVHAATGLALLESTTRDVDQRRRLATIYEQSLGAIDGIGFQRSAAGATGNGSYLAIRIEPARFGLDRNQLHDALRAENIVSRKYFYPLCSENDAYRHLPSAARENLPIAHAVASEVLCLPLFGDLPADDVERVVAAILAIHRAAPAVRRALEEAAR